MNDWRDVEIEEDMIGDDHLTGGATIYGMPEYGDGTEDGPIEIGHIDSLPHAKYIRERLGLADQADAWKTNYEDALDAWEAEIKLRQKAQAERDARKERLAKLERFYKAHGLPLSGVVSARARSERERRREVTHTCPACGSAFTNESTVPVCPYCQGNGISPKPHICPRCNGSGRMGVERGDEYLYPTATTCWPCNGTGIVWGPRL